MKKSLLTALFIAFTAISANACILWKISGNGLSFPSYIFGTHHIAPASICDDISDFHPAFRSCQIIYGEIAMDEINSPETQEILLSYMLAPEGDQIQALLSQEQYEALDSMLIKYAGTGVQQFEMLKPAAITAQLSALLSMRVFPEFNHDEQLDTRLQLLALQTGKPVYGLETVEYQAQLLYETPITEQLDELIQLIEDTTDHLAAARTMAELYMTQNIDSIYSIMTNPQTGFSPQEAERLIYRRNAEWFEILDSAMRNEPIFVVVGAGHLPGERGLLELLRAAGYDVTHTH